PLRLPARPGLSLAGVRLTGRAQSPGRVSRVALLSSSCVPAPILRQDQGSMPFGCPLAAAFPFGVEGRPLPDAFSEPARRSRKFWPDSSLSHPVTHLRPRLPMALLPPPTLGLLPAGTTTCRVGFAPTEQQHLHGAHAAGVTPNSPRSRGFASAPWE